ncbi:MAG TPA: serine/threonine-protein kinase [Polyangiaceae bacterium]|nr:serine/threonine-protein kinase [Polyangiaceae bacterium]
MIGRWTLETFVGSGATATVYRARSSDGQLAAVKLLLPQMAAHDEVRRRFHQEARIVASLDHPSIVRMLDYDVSGPANAYIAFEYLEGETLAARAEREALSVTEIVNIADRVLDALAVAHAAGVVHRDLKPSNVFLTSGGAVKVLDFGVARVTAADATALGTRLGAAIGTTAYMAPEQALGKHDRIDARTDVFSLGAMLFRLLSGEPVHPANSVTEALERTATTPARSLATVASHLPGELIAIVDLCLAFAPSARYPDAPALQRDLRAWLRGEPSSLAAAARVSREQATVMPMQSAGAEQASSLERVVAADGVAPTVMAATALPSLAAVSQAPTELEAASATAATGGASALIGQLLAGRYRVDALLGTGGMGAVYRAEHVHMKKHVALKVLHREMTVVPEVVSRFEREAVAAARIEHPHVAGAKDFGKLEDGSFYLALEYVEGSSLRQLLKKERLAPDRVKVILGQIASALAAAHRLGVVHRDLKPENIMLVARNDGADFVKVLDFGIAKLAREETTREPQLTALGAVFGTPEYMSPEQAMGSAVDAQSDLYSVGVILYEMLAGRTPFAARGMLAVLAAHMTETPPALPGDVHPELARLAKDLLEKRPEARPTAQLLSERLLGAPTAPSSPGATAQAQRGLTERAHASYGRLRERAAAGWQRWAIPLEQRLERAGMRVPLKVLVLAALGLGVLAVLLALVLPDEPDAAATPAHATERVGVALRPDAPGVTVEKSAVPEAVRRDVARIEALPVYKRSYDDWLALAHGTALLGRYKDSTLAYQAVLSLKGSMREDPKLLEDMYRAAHDDASFDLVLNLCSTRLKQPGIDVLWTLWQEWRHDPRRAEQAELLEKKLVVLSRRASRELRTAIELATSDSCSKLAKAVERAVQHADTRALPSLEHLAKKNGCGADRQHDCYPCLRSDDNLARAIARAKSRPAPAL